MAAMAPSTLAAGWASAPTLSFVAPLLCQPAWSPPVCHGSAQLGSASCRGRVAPRPICPPWLAVQEQFRRGLPSRSPRGSNMRMAANELGGSGKGSQMLRGINLELIRILITGELVVGTAATALAFFGNVDPYAGLAFSTPAVAMGCIGALPIFLLSVLLEQSGIDFFRRIDQDTKLYVVQVFGAKRNFPVVFFWSLVLAFNAGLFEEILFRGVIQQWLGQYIGDLPALGVASVAFGLAHSPVPGAASFTEACYGANFGLLYMMSGGNLLVPIVAHVVYDLLTFLEVHYRATAQLETNLTGLTPEKEAEKRNVVNVVRQFNLSQRFVDMSYALFMQLDMNQNGVIDQKELQLGLRTFGKFASDEETRQIMQEADVDKNNALSFDEWVRLLAVNYSALLQPKGNAKLGE